MAEKKIKQRGEEPKRVKVTAEKPKIKFGISRPATPVKRKANTSLAATQAKKTSKPRIRQAGISSKATAVEDAIKLFEEVSRDWG